MKGLLLAAVAALSAASAHAQPPTPGLPGALPRPSILCDTSAQVQSIVDAFQQGVDAAQMRYAELFGTMNHRREPTCAITAIQMFTTEGAESLGRISIEGEHVYGWIVHVENGAGEGYFLYLESPAEALKSSI